MDRTENTATLLQFTGRCLVTAVVYLFVSRSLPINGATCHIAPSLRLFIPISLQACRHFFLSEGCTCDVCDRPRLPLPWLGSHGDDSPTAPVAPSLRRLAPRGSLIRCEPVHVYNHRHLCSFLSAVFYKSLLSFRKGPIPTRCPLPMAQSKTRLFDFRSPALRSS
jgi:hypothetical protein